MIYINSNSSTPTGLEIPITISGAIESPYYELGRTTKAEWDRYRNAPGLFAEFRNTYVRFVVPAKYVRNIEDPEDILTYWQNVALNSTYPYGQISRRYPISMYFDNYVPAGAAVAFVGAWYSVHPTDWATGALSFDSVTQAGNWGTMHEFNHHWQGTYKPTGQWRTVGNPSEVTNNVMTILSYLSYTNIAMNRTENCGSLSGWNRVVDPRCNLEVAVNNSKNQAVEDPYVYASFIHEFGVSKFEEVILSIYNGGTYNGVALSAYKSSDSRANDMAYRMSVIFGKDLTAYMTKVLHWELSSDTLDKIKALKLEKYFPITNLYASGVKGIETGRAFFIPNEETHVFDFASKTYTPGTVESVSVSNVKYGTLTKNEDGTYTYKRGNIPAGSFDEFDLVVRAKFEGITNTRTLKVKLGFNGFSNKSAKSLNQTSLYSRPLYFLKNELNVSFAENAAVIATPNAQPNEGNDPSNLIDGTTSTFFHSRWNGSPITPFPHEYVIDLGDTAPFNQIAIHPRYSNTNGTIGNYEIYVSSDNKTWRKVAEDKNRSSSGASNLITISLDSQITEKYLKIVALNNKNGNNFTVISEIALSNSASANSRIAQNSSLIDYNGDWKKYSVIGSRFNPSLVLSGFSNTDVHNLEVRIISGELNLDSLATDGNFTKFTLITPSKPEEPEEPDEPSDPDDPSEPSEPSKPDKPDEPEKPSPVKPTEPTEPSKPTPEQPTPTTPAESNIGSVDTLPSTNAQSSIFGFLRALTLLILSVTTLFTILSSLNRVRLPARLATKKLPEIWSSRKDY